MTTLTPGQIVTHPEHGHGIYSPLNDGCIITGRPHDGYAALGKTVYEVHYDLTGWQPVETCTPTERAWLDYRGGIECICDTCPETTGGPSEDCEIHGRRYSDWVELTRSAQYALDHAETLRPGHVQVRVDDLDLTPWQGLGDDHYETAALRAGVRAAKAKAKAAQAESHTDAPTTESVADSDTPKYTPGQRYRDCEGDVWVVTGHGKLALEQPDKPLGFGFGFSAWRVEEENGPLTLIDDEQPTTTTASLPCPDCGEDITREVALLRAEGSTPPAWSITPRPAIAHRCQPDEPTDFGARVTVTRPDGSVEKWCRLGKHHPAPWLGERYDVPGETWDLIYRRGTVTLGWGDDQ